jgi:PmbA protein
MTTSSPTDLELASLAVSKLTAAGADAADAIAAAGTSMSVSYRMGKLEDVERSEGTDLGIRAMVKGENGAMRQAVVSLTDTSGPALDEAVERVVAMARIAPDDPYCGLADKTRLAAEVADLDLDDHQEPDADTLATWAEAAEKAALDVEGVTNSMGAGAGWGRSRVALATSDGFKGTYSASSHSVSCSVLAGEGTGMERDYDYSSARHLSELDTPETVGRNAADKAVKRLNPRKMPSQSVPVVYDPRVSGGIVGHLAGAVSGAAVARGTSFMKDKMGQQVVASGLNIIDDPRIVRGRASKPFDGEGVLTEKLALVDDGVLQSWIMDSSSARQLGLETSGRAARGTGGPPGPSTTNLYLEAGSISRDDLIGDIKQGFYITELIGMGVNGVTGDYSRGAAGYWIEDGEITFPVTEITVAGNLKDMFLNLTPASDLVFRYGTNAPTLRIEGMTIAGA